MSEEYKILPLPPKYVTGANNPLIRPMSEKAARAWLASYDAWVALWNRHERDQALPLSPKWSAATTVGMIGLQSALGFRPKDAHCLAVIRMKDFRAFDGKPWSFLRQKARPDAIVWAGYRLKKGHEAGDFVEPMPNC